MDKRLTDPFSASLVRMVFAMTKLQCTSFGATNYSVKPITSFGVASLIHLTGKICGRIMLDVEAEVALALTEKITGTRYTSAREEAV
ncbi:MAG: hypothetical protein E6713_14270, partial [Sporomusaceae bacterium]|nr:hypothetical protein [Sporomusaceae bacterium]